MLRYLGVPLCDFVTPCVVGMGWYGLLLCRYVGGGGGGGGGGGVCVCVCVCVFSVCVCLVCVCV